MSEARATSITVGVLVVPAILIMILFYGLMLFAILFSPMQHGSMLNAFLAISIFCLGVIGLSGLIYWLFLFGKQGVERSKLIAGVMSGLGIPANGFIAFYSGPVFFLGYPMVIQAIVLVEALAANRRQKARPLPPA